MQKIIIGNKLSNVLHKRRYPDKEDAMPKRLPDEDGNWNDKTDWRSGTSNNDPFNCRIVKDMDKTSKSSGVVDDVAFKPKESTADLDLILTMLDDIANISDADTIWLSAHADGIALSNNGRERLSRINKQWKNQQKGREL